MSSTRAIALETTSRRGEVALVEGARLLAVEAFETAARHAASMLPAVDRLCQQQGWAPRDLAEIYVSVGPGGFTGTRIAVTFAKTLAFATGARVVAVPTPRVVVENLPPEAERGVVVIDARRGKAWLQPYHRQQAAREWVADGPPGLTTLSEALEQASRPTWLIGEGLAYHAEALAGAGEGVRVYEDHQPRASVVAKLGWEEARRGRFTDVFALEPVYVRRPEAEEKRLGLG